MTKKEAKELTLEVWRYLRDNPEICEKDELPPELYEQIADLNDECPLCEYSGSRDLKSRENGCPLCPLNVSNCFKFDSLFLDWDEHHFGNLRHINIRETAAAGIVSLVEAWDTGKEDEQEEE